MNANNNIWFYMIYIYVILTNLQYINLMNYLFKFLIPTSKICRNLKNFL